MKCLCLTDDNDLISSLRNLNFFGSVESLNVINTVSQPNILQYDILIISDKLAAQSSLNEICSCASPDTQIFYLLSTYPNTQLYRHIQMQCLSNGTHLIPPGLTTDQIVNHILKIIDPERTLHNSNVIAFFGAQPGTGVTSMVLTLAKNLAESKVSVGVLGLNALNPGDSFSSAYHGLYLDELKNYLNSYMLSEEQLTNNMDLIHNFRYLAGNRDIKKRLYYTSEEIRYLIHIAKHTFDVVLLDAGNQFDNALTIQSLVCSDLRFLITNQNLRSFRSWQLSFEQIIQPLGFDNNNFFMIINRYKDSVNFPKIKYLQDLYNITVLATVPDLGDLGMIAEQEKTLLSTFNVRQFDSALHKIAKNICKLYDISVDTQKTATVGGIISRLFSKTL